MISNKKTTLNIGLLDLDKLWQLHISSANLQAREDIAEVLGSRIPHLPGDVVSSEVGTIFALNSQSCLVVIDSSSNQLAYDSVLPPINKIGGAIFDVSGSRVAFQLSGMGMISALNSKCPLDWDAKIFKPGTCGRSLFGTIAALYYRHAEENHVCSFIARSYESAVRRDLKSMADSFGGEFIPERGFFDWCASPVYRGVKSVDIS